MTVDTLVKELDLLPHPEGGYYKETYRSEAKISQACLSPVIFQVIETSQLGFIF
jgi:predicted cupin superfamily sugar epimerase